MRRCPTASPPSQRRNALARAATTGNWNEEPPPNNPEFADNWFLRCQDLVDKYQPDLLYFDNTEPAPRPGRPRHRRALLQRQHADGTAASSRPCSTAKRPAAGARRRHGAWTIERGSADRHPARSPGRPTPASATGTTTAPSSSSTATRPPRPGHPDAHRHRQQERQPAAQHPVRGDGTIDEDERKFLDGIAAWMPVNGEAHLRHAARGRSTAKARPDVTGTGDTSTRASTRPYTAEDIRFTTKGDTLYAIRARLAGRRQAPSSRPSRATQSSSPPRSPASRCWATAPH